MSDRINKGTVYMTYQWWIGKCNELTMHKVDPVSHTPEDKFSACQVDAIADQVWPGRSRASVHRAQAGSGRRRRSPGR